MKLSLQIKNVDPVIRRLRAYPPAARKGIRAVIGEYAAKEYQMAYDLCPKDTFFMADHIRVEFSPGGYAYYLGWRRRDFTAAGKSFYALYQELSFRHWLSGKIIHNPCLQPTRAVMRPRFERDLARALREAAAGRVSSRFRSARATGRRVS